MNKEQRPISKICPYLTVQRILTGKWSIFILYLLSQKTMRFNEIQRQMPVEMTHTTLSRQLKALEKDGLIIRKEYSQIPPKVEYSLSEIGQQFQTVLNALGEWGDEYLKHITPIE